jgi:hypothetical protein
MSGGINAGTVTRGRNPRFASVGSTDIEDSPYASIEGSISITEMLALRATPKELVPAPGAGKVLQFLGMVLIYDYAAAYTESADNMAVKVENGSGAAVSDTIEATGFLDATADKMIQCVPIKDALLTANKALVLHNTGDGEYGGTGSPLRFKIMYAVHATGL